MSEFWRDSTVILPGRYVWGGQDITFPVTPLTDTWLGAKERTWEEVDEVLEGRIRSLQELFQDLEPNPAKTLYGVEKPLSGNSARLLAYIALVDEYRREKEHSYFKAQDLRGRFDQEREVIKATKYSSGKKRKLIATVTESYNPSIIVFSRTAGEKEMVEDLILRKAVLDIFSTSNCSSPTGEPLVTQNLPKAIDEIGGFALSLEKGEVTHTDYFLDMLTAYLNKTRDHQLFSKYAYKPSPRVASTIKDIQVLDSCYRLAAEPEVLTNSEDNVRKLRKLGEAYFSFLRNRTAGLSFSPVNNENYPIQTVFYDILATCFTRGSLTFLRSLPRVIDTTIGENIHSRRFREDMSSLFIQYWGQIQRLGALVNERFPHHLTVFTKIPFSLIPEDVVHFLSSQERLLYDALNTFSNHPNYQGSSSVMIAEDKIARHSGDRCRRLLKLSQDDFHARNIILKMADSVNFAGRELDVIDLIALQHPLNRKTKKVNHESQLNLQQLLGYGTSYTPEAAFILNTRAPQEIDYTLIERENTFLWDEVLDKPLWFVSPRGDRFRQGSNPDLSTKQISSVTFQIDRNHPRDHRAILKIEGYDHFINYWITSDRQLLSGERKPIAIDIQYKSELLNFLLKKLYFITSGVLSQNPELTETEDAHRDLAYKRAHYRILNSTDTRPITMESPGAVQHAKEILDDYGIDIFAEIKRRRALGTLKPDLYLTFVRETTPTHISQQVQPNNLVFKPELLIIPL